MIKQNKGREFVENNSIVLAAVPNNDGMKRKILAYDDSLMCVENYLEKGAIAPIHSHPHTQIAYIVEGEFIFEVEDRKYAVKKGDSLFIKGNQPHAVSCIQKGIVLDIFTPMREDFVK